MQTPRPLLTCRGDEHPASLLGNSECDAEPPSRSSEPLTPVRRMGQHYHLCLLLPITRGFLWNVMPVLSSDRP